jgi:hypothetical protein
VTEIPRDPGHDLAAEDGHLFAPTGAMLEATCPVCKVSLTRFANGCIHCGAGLALVYAAHLVTFHPEFVQQIKAGLS